MDRSKKITAAISAVVQYLRTEEEMAGASLAYGARRQAASPSNAWGLSGRQVQMQMRTMMGMKAFHPSGKVNVQAPPSCTRDDGLGAPIWLGRGLVWYRSLIRRAGR